MDEMTSRRTNWAIAVMLGLAISLLPSAASAVTLTGMVSPNPAISIYADSPADPGYVTTVTAFTAQALSVGPNEAFERAWNTVAEGWNPSGWTLNWATQSLGTFEIDTYSAYTRIADGRTSGGAEIRVYWNPTPDLTDLKWIQAMYDPSRFPNNPYYLDVINSSINQPPIYPYQSADQYFYDKPYRWRVRDESFVWEACTYLARVDRVNKICTVYEGVYWGFSMDCVAVPEPASIAVLIFGICGCASLRRRARAAR